MTTRLPIAIAALALLAACESSLVKEFSADAKSAWGQLSGASAGHAELNAGLKQYNDGEYPLATKSLQSALDLGLSDKEKVNAHKHLAFIHCSRGRNSACRGEFRKALAIDPKMELAPAEAGHPAWGPIFRSLKAGR
jgi:Tfp pilus assembly protein PilF